MKLLIGFILGVVVAVCYTRGCLLELRDYLKVKSNIRRWRKEGKL